MNYSGGYLQMYFETCLTESAMTFHYIENVSIVDSAFRVNISNSLTTVDLLVPPSQNCSHFATERSDNSTLPSSSLIFSSAWMILEAFALGLMILLTIGGNLLVIVAIVLSPTLRSPTHSLIVNLAVADLLLGVIVLPLSATRELSGVWLLGPIFCSIWVAVDVLCCTASILSLCVISVDRYIGVSRPLTYSRILTKRRAKGLIAGIWTLALAISIAPPLGWKEEPRSGVVEECHVNKQLGYVIFSACGSFYIPALVILVLYTLVYRSAAKHSKFLHSGSRVTRSDVTLRVHMGSTKARNSMRANMYEGSGSTLLMEPGANGVTASHWPSFDQGRRRTIAGIYGRAAKFRRQKKAAKTLGIVVGGFLLCWFPFFILLPLDAACPACDVTVAFNFAFWLGYFNSCINPFIYACSSRELRRAFWGILCWKRKFQPKLHDVMAVSMTSRSRDISLSSTTSISTPRRIH